MKDLSEENTRLQEQPACECAARKALEALIDAAKSYRSDILGQPAAPGDVVGGMFAKYNYAPLRCDRDTVIDEADAALSAPCPCEGLRAEHARAVAFLNRDRDNQAQLKDAARVRWQECQDRLAELERIGQELTDDPTDCESNMRTIAAERDSLRGELATAKADADRWRRAHDGILAEAARMTGSSRESMTWGDLMQRFPTVATSMKSDDPAAEWDNRNISEQRDWALAELAASQEREQALRKALEIQRKAWAGVVARELDGPIVDFAEAQIRRIASTLATTEGTK